MREETISLTDGRVLLTTIAATSYFLFLYLVIHTAIGLDGACLYTFWLPYKDQLYSPYWITVVLVIGLVTWSAYGLATSCLKGSAHKWSIVYYFVAFTVMGWWLYDLWGFWQTMQYERGELTIEQYYGKPAEEFYNSPHQCRGI